MKNQNKFVSALQFFVASGMLFNGLLSFVSALRYRGLENNFVADNWEIPLVVFLIFAFTIGWWGEAFIEYLIINFGRKMLFSLFIFVLLYGLIMLYSLSFPFGFIRYALSTCGYTIVSGFLYRFSVMRLEVIAKLRIVNN
jgi:hypothetical protein